MREVILTLCIVVAMSMGRAHAEEPAAGVQQVISAQITAFRSDAFERAFTFASPNIRRIFGTADRFGEMVKQGYPMVYRPDSFRFLDLREQDGQHWQKVLFRDQAGVFHLLDYQMIRADTGWKINAVRLLDPPDVGA